MIKHIIATVLAIAMGFFTCWCLAIPFERGIHASPYFIFCFAYMVPFNLIATEL